MTKARSPKPTKRGRSKTSSAGHRSQTEWRVIVLEVEDVVRRRSPKLPNIFVGTTIRTAADCAKTLRSGTKGRPAWARGRVVKTRDDLAPAEAFGSRSDANRAKQALKRKLSAKGYTVNQVQTTWRVYVIELDDATPGRRGKGHRYVGQTSKAPEERLLEHLHPPNDGGRDLGSRHVRKHGIRLVPELTETRTLFSQQEALREEKKMAQKLEREGYCVKGGH